MAMDNYAVQKAAVYIEAHLDRRLTLDEVSAYAGYSKYHFDRMFRKATDCTVYQYIRKRRLTEAARALVFTRQPVMEIAQVSGYESQQAFTQAFGEVYRLSPAAYRRQRVFFPAMLPYVLQTTSYMQRRCAA